MQGNDQVLTGAQMREAEARLIADGVSVDELMQRAGRGAADWVWRMAAGRPVTVLCGPGNNGGDGYVIAQALAKRGLFVSVVAPVEPKTEAARKARSAWIGNTTTSPPTGHGGVFVDCLFGSGLTRPLAAEHDAMLADLAARHAFSVAVDLPSGVATDDGALLGGVPRFDLTLALGAWKPAHFLLPALERLGATRLVDIGISPAEVGARVAHAPALTAPVRDAHKYSRGLVGVVGGAMPGASVLSATTAMRAGAGYVKLLASAPPACAPAALVVDLEPLEKALADRRWSSLLVGPGLGRDDCARDRLDAVLEARLPTVLDADALHLLDWDLLEGVDAQHLLATPHDGELATMCAAFGVDARDKLTSARGLAEITGVTVLAKGPDTVLAAPDGQTAFFPSGPSWLATAGTGDVLAGLAASRLGTGLTPFEAASEAVWLHAEAARAAGPAFAADDLVSNIPAAYARFL
ncbi:NAD(P)H-hydrate dehydratase [Tsuneonella sp. HG249]